jgi:hypothetical protein
MLRLAPLACPARSCWQRPVVAAFRIPYTANAVICPSLRRGAGRRALCKALNPPAGTQLSRGNSFGGTSQSGAPSPL